MDVKATFNITELTKQAERGQCLQSVLEPAGFIDSLKLMKEIEKQNVKNRLDDPNLPEVYYVVSELSPVGGELRRKEHGWNFTAPTIVKDSLNVFSLERKVTCPPHEWEQRDKS